MKNIEDLNENSFLLNGVPHTKVYEFRKGVNDSVLMVSIFDRTDIIIRDEKLENISILGKRYDTIEELMFAFEPLKKKDDEVVGFNYQPQIDELKSKLPLIFILPLNFVTTITNRISIPGMNFQVVAGKKYKIKILGDVQTSSNNTGISVGFVLSSGIGTIKGYVNTTQSTNPTASTSQTIRAINAINTTPGSFMTTLSIGTANIPHYLDCDLIFTCTTSGVFSVQFASEINSVAQLNSGTVMIVTPLN